MNNKSIAMIPARLGSQRLKKKNLEFFGEVTLIEHAIQRCIDANIFDEIYVNSESLIFKEYAESKNVNFYHRSADLGNNQATSEDFVYDFLSKIDCDNLYQVHSITPLLDSNEILNFYNFCEENENFDTVLSCIEDQIEVAFENIPINFVTSQKTNSQELKPTQRITWSVTKWKKETFIKSVEMGLVGTYSGKIGYYPVGSFSGLAIKTHEDLKIANAIRDIFK